MTAFTAVGGKTSREALGVVAQNVAHAVDPAQKRDVDAVDFGDGRERPWSGCQASAAAKSGAGGLAGASPSRARAIRSSASAAPGAAGAARAARMSLSWLVIALLSHHELDVTILTGCVEAARSGGCRAADFAGERLCSAIAFARAPAIVRPDPKGSQRPIKE